jgi:2-polyprenyl-3-methyl-5-hydroxy-6-metoxy-1,4-benzoquinol methylase
MIWKKLAHRKWRQAQRAEKESWKDLWDSKASRRKAQARMEIKKQTFILKKMEEALQLDLADLCRDKSVLDVGCGPVSYVARMDSPAAKEGVDPLKYPDWVYEDYKRRGFLVHISPFEELRPSHQYDVILFYNALQHFNDLVATASKCREISAKNGKVLMAEYLEIPTDEAHIQFLTKEKLDDLLLEAGFKIASKVIKVRLPGLVEMGGGKPIKLYVAMGGIG